MAKKNRKTKRRKTTKKQKVARQRNRQQTTPPVRRPGTHALDLNPPEQCLDPIHLDSNGTVVPNPRATLGLEPGPLDEQTVRAAYRKHLLESPPEVDPEGARLVREARDHLISPAHAIEHIAGEVRVPDPDAWGLRSKNDRTEDRVDAKARLIAQALIYALVEDEMTASSGKKPDQIALFD